MKQYILFAGVNGSGKSTLYHSMPYLYNLPRVNTDEIVATFGSWKNNSDVIKAGKIAVQEIKTHFQNEESFIQETTLCGKSVLENIRIAKSNGYQVIIHYVGVESAEIAKERVANRVLHGGHGIPDKDIDRRFFESMKNIQQVRNYCDEIHFYDNTNIFYYFASLQNGVITAQGEFKPEWFKKMNI